MRPNGLRTKIFLDSADPSETREAISLLGFLDGQTTNPTYVSKHPDVRRRLAMGKPFSRAERNQFYRSVAGELSEIIPDGSISLEVYADEQTTAEEMLAMGREMNTWIPNAHIKYPTTREGIAAAALSLQEGIRVNMTLVFSQSQAGAVWSATNGAKPGDVFVSPFVGRLDDRGTNGIDVVKNIVRMYEGGDGHVQVLTGSVRNLDHVFAAISAGSNIVTMPISLIKTWVAAGMLLPAPDFTYVRAELQSVPYQDMDLGQPWETYDIRHELTEKGIQTFAADWNALAG